MTGKTRKAQVSESYALTLVVYCDNCSCVCVCVYLCGIYTGQQYHLSPTSTHHIHSTALLAKLVLSVFAILKCACAALSRALAIITAI